jgi:hypothetical protein
MKKSQFFSHRPPSQTTLLNDPWPAALRVRKPRRIFDWLPYRGGRTSADSNKTESTGLQA